MLPDFVRVKEKRRRRFTQAVHRETEKLTPLLNHIRTVQQHEGSRLQYQTVEGFHDTVTYDNKISSALRIEIDKIADMDERVYVERAKEMAVELARQAMQHFFSMMDRWTAEAGTVTSAGGHPIDPLMLITALEKSDIDFDELGRPKLQTVITTPENLAALNEKFADPQIATVYRRRMNELMERKWIEWRDREADRKLVE